MGDQTSSFHLKNGDFQLYKFHYRIVLSRGVILPVSAERAQEARHPGRPKDGGRINYNNLALYDHIVISTLFFPTPLLRLF